MSHPAFCGLDRAHLGGLIEELANPWTARCESALRERRGGDRRRAAGAGPDHKLAFTDRVLVTVVYLRLQLPHAALAELYGVTRPTVTHAIHEIRPLLAARGFAVPHRPGIRLRSLADVFAYAEAEGVELRIDGTETQVRRPKAGRSGRKAFVSGKKKQNTAKTTTIADDSGRLLWSGADRPGRMHDQTAIRTEGITEQLCLHPQAKAKVDEGYRGLANGFPDQVQAPPRKPKDEAPLGERYSWREERRRHSSARICVEHTIGEVKKWRPLQRYIGRREYYTETHTAIAGLVSDRAARRPTRRRTSTELVFIRPAAC
ncbi:transposase [Streptomyces sp. JV185]|uniref:transposase family protein n=1 Tax=Streptomyces sp. JV185 TaxID=858638 RepID=UPI002E7A156A|nr:transposase family protein [Streptomyces sp. JV185]MEE1767052.1 transposase [Streptomyces sp. JV185]